MLVRIKETINLLRAQVLNVLVADSSFIGYSEYITNRVPGDVAGRGNQISAHARTSKLKNELHSDFVGHTKAPFCKV